VIDGRHTNYLYKIVAAAISHFARDVLPRFILGMKLPRPIINDARPSDPGKDFLIYVDICFAVGS